MKFKLMSFLLFGFTIISCEKEVLKENQQTNFELTDESEQIIRSNSGIHEAFKTMSYDEARSAFQTLSRQETKSLYLSKIKEYANTLSLNAQKIECIKFLEKIVQNLPSSNELKLQEELWLEKSKLYFSDIELFNLGYGLNTLTKEQFDNAMAQTVAGKAVPPPPPLNNCNCSTSSAFACVSGFGGTCSAVKCNLQSLGCGFLGGFDCQGRCIAK